MTKPKLTKTRIDALEVRSSDYVEWCGALTGFGIRIRPSGAKSFIAQFRVRGQRAERKVTVGRYGKLTVEQARTEASKILAKAELGEDVAAERAAKRAERTIAELCDDYLAHGCTHKKASTIATDRGRIARHIVPLLGRKAVSEVTSGDVERFLRDVAAGKTATDVKTKKHGRARVTGGKGTATRTVRLLGAIFTYAGRKGEANPCAGVRKFKDGENERFLQAAELGRLGDALREAETAGLPWQFREGAKTKHRAKSENARDVISPHAVAAIRLLIFTGCRAGEILNLMWQDVDAERGFVMLADSKTGRKPVLLSAPALQVLAEVPRVVGNPFVIVGDVAGKPRSDLKRPWARIRARAGLDDLRLHDLRHTFASAGAASGLGLPVLGKLLGHKSPKTTARYAHLADDPLRRASEAIAGSIDAAMAASVAKEDS